MNKTTLRIAILVCGLVALACGTTTVVTPAAPPTATLTSVPPQPTATLTRVPPTATSTSAPPAATATFTPVPPTATSTFAVGPILKVTTNLRLLPTATATSSLKIITTIGPKNPIQLNKPDLYVSEFQLTPNPPDHTKAIHVRVGVYNKGTAATGGSFKVEWWAGSNYPAPACSWTVDSLPASGGQILQCDKGAGTWGSWYSKITTQVRVDPGNAIAESDEGNNVYNLEISVK